MELTKTEEKKKRVNLSSRLPKFIKFFYVYTLLLVYFPLYIFKSQNTHSLSVFKLKFLVSASLSLSITLSFKPYFTTSTNWWCQHPPPVSNIVPVLSRKNQWRKGQRAGESPSGMKRRKPVDQMAFLGQVQYRLVSINRPESDIYPGMAEMIPVWPVFNPEWNHYVFVSADLSEWKIPAVPAGTVRNRLPWLKLWSSLSVIMIIINLMLVLKN